MEHILIQTCYYKQFTHHINMTCAHTSLYMHQHTPHSVPKHALSDSGQTSGSQVYLWMKTNIEIPALLYSAVLGCLFAALFYKTSNTFWHLKDYIIYCNLLLQYPDIFCYFFIFRKIWLIIAIHLLLNHQGIASQMSSFSVCFIYTIELNTSFLFCLRIALIGLLGLL